MWLISWPMVDYWLISWITDFHETSSTNCQLYLLLKPKSVMLMYNLLNNLGENDGPTCPASISDNSAHVVWTKFARLPSIFVHTCRTKKLILVPYFHSRPPAPFFLSFFSVVKNKYTFKSKQISIPCFGLIGNSLPIHHYVAALIAKIHKFCAM